MVILERTGIRALLWAVFLALMGIAASLYVTGPHGLAMATDAAFYYQGAVSFSEGDGFVNYYKDGTPQPMTHYPPLYSVALALGRFMGLSVDAWARVLQAGLLGVNIFLTAMMAFWLVGRTWAVLISGLSALVFVHYFQLHVTAISEPLFFIFMLPALWALIRFVDEGDIRYLLACALLASGCLFTRYAGMAVVITLGMMVWLFLRADMLKRWLGAFAAVLLALALPLLWFMDNMSKGASPAGFLSGISWAALGGVGLALDTASQYLLPASVPLCWREAVAVVFLGGLALMVIRVWRMVPIGAAEHRMRAAWQIISIFWAVHFMCVLAVILLSNGAVRFEPRILLPLPATMFVLLPTLFVLTPLKSLRVFFALTLAIVLGLMALRSAQLGMRIHQDGHGYYSRTWADARVVKAVKDLPSEIPVYTNDPEAFYLYTGRHAVMIPHGGIDAAFFPPMDKARADFVSAGAVAVIFEAKNFLPDPLWWELVRTAGLRPVLRDGWGEIYRTMTERQ